MPRRSRLAYTQVTCGAIVLACIIAGGPVLAQTLYKYRGGDGEWIYADRPPPGEEAAETRQLDNGGGQPQLTVVDRQNDNQVSLIAQNEFYSPVEVVVALDELRNVGFPPPEMDALGGAATQQHGIAATGYARGKLSRRHKLSLRLDTRRSRE
jgi:hypothetical protein